MMSSKHPLIGLALAATVMNIGAAQSLTTKFHGEDAYDRAGSAVAISGEVAVVGAPRAHGSSVAGDGAAYVLRRVSGAWPATVTSANCTEIAPPASIYTETFGSSVAIHGSLIVVGEPEMNTSIPISDNGAAYAYFDDGVAVTYEAEFVPTSTVNALTGSAVAAFVDSVALGAPGAFGSTTDPGHVYIFRRSSSAPHWSSTPEATLAAPLGAVGDRFGYSVAMHGAFCIVGAPNHAGGATNSGAAYVFARVGAAWVFDGELAPLTAAVSAFFGHSVDYDGNLAIVGAEGEDAAYLFRRNSPGHWQQVLRIEGIDPARSEGFGWSVAIDGDRAAIGAHSDDVVHVFRRIGPANWVRSQRLHEEFTSSMGACVDLQGGDVVAGAPFDGDAGTDSGAAHFLQSPPYIDHFGFGDVGNCPCANDDPYGGCANSTGRGTLLTAQGTNSVAADGLVLKVSRMPALKACILMMGDGRASAPLGSGIRVVVAAAEGFSRMPLGASNGAGDYSFGPAIGALVPNYAGFVTPGETWNFQCWHRDTAHGACIATSNLSNAIAVTFAP